MNLMKNKIQICTRCNKEKLKDDFYKANNKRGTMSICKICKQKENKKLYLKEEVKLYKSEYNKKWRQNKKDKKQETEKKWRQNNKKRYKKTISEWNDKNKEHLKKYRNKWRKSNYKNNLNFKISNCLRRRLNKAINGNYKSGSAIKDLGCSIEELKVYLESKFLTGMSWENHGLHGWHIDHIKPLSSFNLENREEFLKACNYTNLQPLWAKDNLKKGAKHEDI